MSSSFLVPNGPPLRRLPGPELRPLSRSVYELPPNVTRTQRTYSRRQKLEVLKYLENHRIPLRPDLSDLTAARLEGDSPVEEGFRRPFLREAAEHFGIQSWGTVQTWWSKRHQIWQGRRLPPRYRPRWPALEARLFAEFCAARDSRRLVQRSWFMRRATAIFADLYPDANVFVFSNGWFRAFLRRHQISHRRVTHASTRVPEEIVKYTNEFLQFIRRNSRMTDSWMSVTLMSDPGDGISLQRFPPHLILNLDETPMPFEFLDGFTYDHKGTDSVQGRSERSGWSKRQATLVLTIVGDGSTDDLLKPVIIFHGKGKVMPKESGMYHPGVEVKFNETAYNNETLFEEWIRTRLAAYTEGRDCLLVVDVARFHKTPRIQTAFKENNITVAMIPPGLTGYLQPLDVGFNGPFKRWLRDETELYLDRLDSLGTRPDKWTIRDRRIMATHVVAKAWQRAFSENNITMVSSLFKKTGISVHPDGREDHLISIKGIPPSQLRLDEWYRAPDANTNYDMSESLDANEEIVSTLETLGVPPNTYRTHPVKALKVMCRQRGLATTGRKIQLVQRLEDHDIAMATAQRERDERDREIDQAVSDQDDTQVVQQRHPQGAQSPAAVDDHFGAGTRAFSSGTYDLDLDTPDLHARDERANDE